MHPFQQRLFICGSEERDEFRALAISHLITISNSEAASAAPGWFRGRHLKLHFGDVVSEADAERCNTVAPCTADIRRALNFFREAWAVDNSRILVSCDYGASRSPALAYVCLADRLGPGQEAEALQQILSVRPGVVPNDLVVHLGDTFLSRNGALLRPVKEWYARLYAELFQKKL